MKIIEDSERRWSLIVGDVCDGLQYVRREYGQARLIFADPPYNKGIDYGNGPKADRRTPEEYLAWVGKWLEACRDCLTDDGSLWVLICDEYAAEYCVKLKQLGMHIRNWVIWYETFGANCRNKFNRTHRHLFHAIRNPRRFVFNHVPEIMQPSARQTKYKDKRAAAGGKLLDDVWQIPRVCGTYKERIKGVPTQVPVALLRRVVACASDVGDLVVDPFVGSGTTGQAAIEAGRRFVGIDCSQKFIDITADRLNKSCKI